MTFAACVCSSLPLNRPSAIDCATMGMTTASTIGTTFNVVRVCFSICTARSPPETPP